MKKLQVKLLVLFIAIMLLIPLLFPCHVKAATTHENAIQPLWYDPTGEWPGYLFLTLDSNKSGWNHGHAGIGGDIGQTIEAYNNTGVRVFANGYLTNWQYCSTGGIYSVYGASISQYEVAKNYAYAQNGKNYSLNPLDGDSAFYCSELVYKAWKEAGITIGTNILGMVTPESIMNHSNTVLVCTF